MGRCKALREFFDFMAEQAGYCVERGGVLAFFLGIFDIIFCLCVFFFSLRLRIGAASSMIGIWCFCICWNRLHVRTAY